MWFSTADAVELCVRDVKLRIIQDNDTMHVGTTVWEASLVFAKWLERAYPDGTYTLNSLHGKRAIELGSGCGISGLAMAVLGCNVCMTDIQPVIPILKKNIKRNTCTLTDKIGKIKTAQLYWGNRKHIDAMKPPYDYVVATDVVYLEEIVLPLIHTMHALSNSNTVIFLGYKLRQEEAHKLFWETLPLYFEITPVPTEELHPEYSFEGVTLYILKQRPSILQ